MVRAWGWRQRNPWPARPGRRSRHNRERWTAVCSKSSGAGAMRPIGAWRGRSSARFCLGPEPHRISDWRTTRRPSRPQQEIFFRGLRLSDLVLARACAGGNEQAWEHFVTVYRQPLTRAAIAITGSETLGRDLADQLYAELYGLTAREGERRCPLLSYRGRGSLMGWLRTTLAQRHVDHHRRSRREQPLGEWTCRRRIPAPATPSRRASQFWSARSKRRCESAMLRSASCWRHIILTGKHSLQIARVLGVHEATVSRKLRRATEGAGKQVLRNLQRDGLSRRAAEEALGADPRDLDVNLKKLLQNSQIEAFKEQAAP